VAAFIGLLVVLPGMVIIWLRVPEGDPTASNPARIFNATGFLLPLLMVIWSVALGITGWWFRRHRPVSGWERPRALRLSPIAAVPIGIVVGFGGLVFSGLVTTMVFRPLGIQPARDELISAGADSGGLVLAGLGLLAVVVAPIGEELFFRGYLFRWSASRCGMPYAYALSTTIFALAHFNPFGLPLYLTFGLILAWSYQRWRTLVVPIAAHATLNAIVVAGYIARAA
jgi:membrane protease YdiL (CAAX protease family)